MIPKVCYTIEGKEKLEEVWLCVTLFFSEHIGEWCEQR